MNDSIKVITLIVILLFFFMLYRNKYSQLITVKSNIDKETYLVRKNDDSVEAANLLSKLKNKLIKLVEVMKINFPHDKRIKLLVIKFNPKNISESIPNTEYTSYSVNKGEKIVFCIRNKTTNKLIGLNTVLFVAIHELAHIMTISIGHTEEFWNNMRFLLKNAIKHNIYKVQDFKNKPVTYCGTKITNSPL